MADRTEVARSFLRSLSVISSYILNHMYVGSQ